MAPTNRVGEVLRAAREQRGLSVAEAAQQAGIPLQYVQLLEGEKDVTVGIADELYLVPFLRRYATFLGLEAGDLLPEFLGYLHVTSEAPPPSRLTYRSPFARLWKPALIAIAVAGAAVVMFHRSPQPPVFEDMPLAGQEPASGDRELGSEPETGPASPASSPVPAGTELLSPGLRPGADALTPFPATPTPFGHAATPVGGHQLQLSANETAWIMLGVDDQPKESFLLQAGEARTFTARDAFVLTLGNAGGVTIVLDGSALPPVGRSGEVVRNVRLPPYVSPTPRG